MDLRFNPLANRPVVGHDDVRHKFIFEDADPGIDRFQLGLNNQGQGSPPLPGSLFPQISGSGFVDK